MDVREKLVELIKKANEECVWKDCVEGCKFYMSNDCRYNLMADMMIRNGVAVQEWVKVEDRLPETHTENDGYDSWEESDNVLVLCKSGRMAVSKYGTFMNESYWCGCDMFTEKVTHWMPLPQPPKGD